MPLDLPGADAIESRCTTTDFRFSNYRDAILGEISDLPLESQVIIVACMLQESSLRRFHSASAPKERARGIAQIQGAEPELAFSVSRSTTFMRRYLTREGFPDDPNRAYAAYSMGPAGALRDPERATRLVGLMRGRIPAARVLLATRGDTSFVSFDAIKIGAELGTRCPRLVYPVATADGTTTKPVDARAQALWTATRRYFPGGAAGLHRPANRVTVKNRGQTMDPHNAGVAVDIAVAGARGFGLFLHLLQHAQVFGIVMLCYAKIRWVCKPNGCWQQQEDNDHFNHVHVQFNENVPRDVVDEQVASIRVTDFSSL